MMTVPFFEAGNILSLWSPAPPTCPWSRPPATGLLCRPGRFNSGRLTPQGKQQAHLNALQHGLHSDPSVQGPTCPRPNCWRTGLDRVPDSPAKFEKMLSCLGVLISQAKQSEFQLDPERGGACSGGDLPVAPDGWGGIAAGRTGLAEGKAEAGSAGEGTEQMAAAQQGLFGTRAVGSVE